MRLMTTLAATFLATLLLGGCSMMSTGNPDPAPLDGTAWILSELPGRTLAPGPAVTLRFADGKAQGSDGCNRYSAPYRAAAGKLEVSAQGVSTMMACAPELMQQAAAYMAALNGARAWRVEDRQLKLAAADGRALASFAAQDTTLAGTAWRVTGINNGKQAVVSVLSGTTMTLAFAADGRATGSAGCNTFNAPFESDGTRLRIGQAAMTRRVCAGKGIMDQELAFVRALQTVAAARIDGNRLELRTADGALAISAARE
jgi:heat shock protein HslJ